MLISRLEPENNIKLIVQGFGEANPKCPLLVVGDFTSQRYKKQVYEEALNGSSANVLFLGSIYDPGFLWMLRQHCLAYFHGHSVGGTNPSLLEAMASKNLILAHDNPFNREVCDRFAHYFSTSTEVCKLVDSIEKNPESPLRKNVYGRAAAFSWDHIGELYDSLFKGDHGAARDPSEIEMRSSQET